MSQDIENVNRKELTQLYRKMDLLSTIYEKQHRRYRFRVRFMDLLLLLAVLIFSFMILVDPKILEFTQLKPDQVWFLLRIDSIMILTLMILTFTLDWKEKAVLYLQAKETLAVIKIDCREMLKLETPEHAKIFSTKNIEYNSIINRLPAIPEQVYNKLKTYHKRRLELSRMLESFPGSSVWLMRIFIFCRANIHLLLRKPFLSRPLEENQ